MCFAARSEATPAITEGAGPRMPPRAARNDAHNRAYAQPTRARTFRISEIGLSGMGQSEIPADRHLRARIDSKRSRFRLPRERALVAFSRDLPRHGGPGRQRLADTQGRLRVRAVPIGCNAGLGARHRSAAAAYASVGKGS